MYVRRSSLGINEIHHSFIHSELKATFTHATQTLDPEQLLISEEGDTQLSSVLYILLQARLTASPG